MGVFGNRMAVESVNMFSPHSWIHCLNSQLFRQCYISYHFVMHCYTLYHSGNNFISRTWEGKGEERERSWVDDTWCFERVWLCCHSHVEFHSEYTSGGFCHCNSPKLHSFQARALSFFSFWTDSLVHKGLKQIYIQKIHKIYMQNN